ncbi:MAG: hemerythrin domain-containing protein [Polyangiaceae bacterium]
MNDLFEELSREHALIERTVGALQTYVRRLVVGAAPAADGARFVSFFQAFLGALHHDREEHVLIPALVALGLPADRGPIPALRGQHEALSALLTRMTPLFAQAAQDPESARSLESLTTQYAHGLFQHIDAEESVFFPESAGRLRRACAVLEVRAPRPEEAAAAEDGARLVASYPPEHDATVLRGDGCIMCPSYGTTCEGLERAWWNESEWDELDDHLG